MPARLIVEKLSQAGRLNATAEIPNPKSEKFSFRLLQAATSSGNSRRPDRTRSLGMKIVAIANQKGGVGKTTTAVNLGAGLAELGQRILLIDLDPQANATSSFGLQAVEQTSLYEPLLGGASITERIFPTRRDALFIVPADIDLAGVEVEIARMPDHLTRLAETLKPLHTDETFDFVLLDCPQCAGCGR